MNLKERVFLCTDGSKVGVGGYIYQKVAGEERVVSYYSRSTTKEEKKWDTRELEVLAIIVTLEHFTHLIEGLPITVQTDHRNLKWLMAMKDPQGRLGRWVLRLQRHRFDVEYRAGKANEVADALSRLPVPEDAPVPPLTDLYGGEPELEALLIQLTEEVNGSAHYELEIPEWTLWDGCDDERSECDLSEAMYEARDLELRALMAPADLPPELQMKPVDYEMIKKAQEEDPECSGLRAKLQSGDKRVAAQFEDVDGMLFKVSHADDANTGEDKMRPCIPKKLRPMVLHNEHSSVWGGHSGVTATYKQVAAQYFWPENQ